MLLRNLIFSVSLVLFWFLPAHLTMAAKPTLPEYHIMTEDFFPFGYLTPTNELTGIAVEIVNAILPELGVTSGINVLPWPRALRQLDSQSNQVLFAMARTPAREEKYRWVGPLLADRIVMFQRRSDQKLYSTMIDARNASSVGVTRDYPEHAYLLGEGFTNLKVVSTPEMMVRFLMNYRTPLIVGGGAVIADLAQHAGFQREQIKMTEIELFRVDLYIALSKDTSDSEVERWQQALDRFKANAAYHALLVKYFFSE